MKKNIIKIVAFFAILAFLFYKFHTTYVFKLGDGIYSMSNFYNVKENSIDVMFFGSSRVYEGVNTGVLWDEYGMASYDLCASDQPLWNTYYYIKEALKTQTPKLVVVDCFGARQTEDYIESDKIIKSHYGMKLSVDKIDSVKVSSAKGDWADYILEYPTYHNRYNEDMTFADFLPYNGKANFDVWKGHGINTKTASKKRQEGIEKITERENLTPKVEKYLRKIIELLKSEDIPLVLIVTPYPVSPGNEEHVRQFRIYNTVADIADEYGVPFINYNLFYDEMGIDFETDFADSVHLNYKGNPKFTSYMGAWIEENYEIPDRRGDEAYDDYNRMSKDCRMTIYDQELRDIKEFDQYIDKTKCDDYLVVVTASGRYKDTENYPDIKEKLMTIGINLDDVSGDAAWVIDKGRTVFSSNNEKEYCWHTDLSDIDVLMVQNSGLGEDSVPVINYNNSVQQPVSDGITIFIYDRFTEDKVEAAGFSIGSKSIKTKKTTD